MALAEANQIISSLRDALARRQQRVEFAQQQEKEQQRLETQQKAENSLASYRKSQMDLEKKRIDAEQASAQVQRNLLIQQATGNILQGIPYPGDPATPGTLENGIVAPLGPGMPQTAVHSIPGVPGQFELPTPEAHAQQMAQLKEITNAPEEAKAAAISQAQAEAQGKQRMLEIQAQLEGARKNAIEHEFYENQRSANQIKANAALENQRSATTLRAKQLEVTGGMMGWGGDNPFSVPGGIHILTGPGGQPQVNSIGPADIYKNAVDDATNLRLSSDEFEKRYKKQAPFLMNMLRTQGIGFLDKDHKSQVDDYNTAAKVTPQIQEMVQLRSQYPTEVFIPGTDAYKMYQKDYDLVSKNIPAMSRIFSGVKRFNSQEFDKYMEGMIPRRNPFTSDPTAGIDKFNDFVQTIQNGFNTATSQLPPGHQAIVRQNIGINNLPYLDKTLHAPGSVPNQAPGTTAPNPTTVKPGQVMHWTVNPQGALVQVGASQ